MITIMVISKVKNQERLWKIIVRFCFLQEYVTILHLRDNAMQGSKPTGPPDQIAVRQVTSSKAVTVSISTKLPIGMEVMYKISKKHISLYYLCPRTKIFPTLINEIQQPNNANICTQLEAKF